MAQATPWTSCESIWRKHGPKYSEYCRKSNTSPRLRRILGGNLGWYTVIEAKGHKLTQIPGVYLGPPDVVGQYQQLLDSNNKDNGAFQPHPLPIHLYYMVYF